MKTMEGIETKKRTNQVSFILWSLVPIHILGGSKNDERREVVPRDPGELLGCSRKDSGHGCTRYIHTHIQYHPHVKILLAAYFEAGRVIHVACKVSLYCNVVGFDDDDDDDDALL